MTNTKYELVRRALLNRTGGEHWIMSDGLLALYDDLKVQLDTIEAKIDASGQAWQQPRQDAFTHYSDGEIAELLSIKADTKLHASRR